ncbi:MAG: DNA/RNA non-specific endonuclease [Sedimentisphaerales bacterium]|nr:DNA/RNA non-specific endonuclease [Sedimentisphaerales bacterium]
MNMPSLKRETRYGMPAADQIMFNRHYVLGYSYYFRQAKWALEIIDPRNPEVERKDHFRPDYRIPEMFRADLVDYKNSGYDRGHLVASANKTETDLQNSETFLLSNMSPQRKQFNRDIWRELETKVRELNEKSTILETYVICGPIFYFDQAVESIGTEDDNDVSIPIPHAYFKSILTEDNKGRLHMWSFIMANEESDEPLDTFQVSTTLVEKLAGIKLWERLVGKKIDKEKSKVRKLW